MAPRAIGAALGLLAFSTTIVAGLVVRNPIGVTLMRSIWAMFLFCVIGLAIGAAVQTIVREHTRGREKKLFALEDDEREPELKEQNSSTGDLAEPMHT
jgi:hypothetical protein